ncbi:MAG: PAS domain S-box protein [Deltaproteobacteria bacterium]|nr:MAG: PAS domain S-box protein [Deltaproteobacteria bacterium]
MAKDEKNTIKRIGKISEQVLGGIVQSIEAAVVLHDRHLKVVFVNDSFEKVFEIPAQDAMGRSPMDFLPEFDERHKEAIFSRLQNTLLTGVKSPYHEFSYCSPAGKYRQLLATSIPIFDNNREITHVMSVIHDVTRRKELEQEAVKAAKLSSVADMAYTLAHEINNPLTGIRLGLSTLYDGLKKEENIQILDSVMKDLNRIQNTVHGFLKARKKPTRLNREKLFIIEVIIDDVLFHLSGQLDVKNIEVQKQLSSGDYHILMDRDGIHRVLLNVLLNAIQAIRREGKITISSTISSPEEGGMGREPLLCLSVADSGVGIEEKKRQEVFKPFYSSKPGGTGLGLSISKNIVSAHSGYMAVESEKGRGTTVRIYLPISPAP